MTARRRVCLSRLAGAIGVVCFTASASLSACSDTSVSMRGDWGQAQFQIEIADTEATRSKGLMHRDSMAPMSGMLFLYDSPRPMAFWMRNTLIPLDLLFIAPNGEVLAIKKEAQPLDETVIPGPAGSIAVLELNGGMAETLGITVGSQTQYSFFDQFSNSWPCEAS